MLRGQILLGECRPQEPAAATTAHSPKGVALAEGKQENPEQLTLLLAGWS